MFISSSRTYGWRVSHGAYIRRVAFFFRSLIRDQSRRCSIGSMHVHDLLISPGFRPPNTLVFLRALISFVKVCSRFFGLLLFLYLFHREMVYYLYSDPWISSFVMLRSTHTLQCSLFVSYFYKPTYLFRFPLLHFTDSRTCRDLVFNPLPGIFVNFSASSFPSPFCST